MVYLSKNCSRKRPGFKQAKEAVATAVDLYNGHRPHSSVDMLTREQAHLKTGEIRRSWKSYYKAAAKQSETI